MDENFPADYLAGLDVVQQEELSGVNRPGLAALCGYLSSGDAVAFLGAGASAPLYPLWGGLIGQLADAASGRMTRREAETCRALARERPEEVAEFLRQRLGTAAYREVLRVVLRVRTDPVSGRSWTPVQELVCRCAFRAVVTTNYDPGIVNARMRVRPAASATGFTTWEDELELDRWRSGDAFGDAELPVLFAHGQHNRPDSVVLATAEYRRAYAGKLPQVLGELVHAGHLVWIGFSFADQRITAILREIASVTGTRADPGTAPRHVVLMPWDPAARGNDPAVLAQWAQISYGAQAVMYPAAGGDHSALRLLLSALADDRFPAADDLPARPLQPARIAPDQGTSAGGHDVPVKWMPGPELVEYFTGRAEELDRLDRWAADPEVALVGVTQWGGAGKTALVTHWVQNADGASRRPAIRGVFGWSFYADPSYERWAAGLLAWAEQELGIEVSGAARAASRVLGLLRTMPLLLVLDGLEVVQEGPAGDGYGRFLDGTLREILSGVCRRRQGGLVILTSRFPFADLESFDGSTARMLDVPRFTPAEGAALLAAAGGDWVGDAEQCALVEAVDGHALAVGVLAGALADRPPAADLAALRVELTSATCTSARVSRVLRFYADRLPKPDQYLLAAISLFARPVPAESLLAVAGHDAFAGHLAGWTPAMVQTAVRDRLAGLASWHPDRTVSAHALVRDAFRPLALGAAKAAAETALAGLPDGSVRSRTDASRVVEAIELLLDAGQWQPAARLYHLRVGDGVFRTLPAARLGQRATSAFVATPARRDACVTHLRRFALDFYLNQAGLFATYAGDLSAAREYLTLINDVGDAYRRYRNPDPLLNLAACLGYLGEIGPASTPAVVRDLGRGGGGRGAATA